MLTINFDKSISKQDELFYYFEPFEVPEGIEKLEFFYSYEGDTANSQHKDYEKNVIDFGLKDENGDDIGTRGSNTKHIIISPTYSTPGFKYKLPNPGTWTIIIGAYMIKTGGVTVHYTINMYERQSRWLKGDLHLHTNNSDGKYTRLQLAEKCRKKGLDYMVFTDHNNNTKGEGMPTIKDLTIIRGVELTNYRGHVNFWGHEKPFSGTFAINNDDDILKAIDEAKSNGALVSLNHPHCTHCPWLFTFDVPYDSLEIWNGPMRKDNLKTIKYWDDLLKQGKHITAVGGSDYHQDYVVTSLLAEPTTHVKADANTESAIFEAIKKGKVTISKTPNGTMIDMKCGNAEIGDTVSYKKGLEVEIIVKNLKAGNILHVYDAEGEYFTFKAKSSGTQTFKVPVRGKGYVRAEVTYQKHFLNKLLHRVVLYFMIKKEAFEPVPPFPCAISNPIYFE